MDDGPPAPDQDGATPAADRERSLATIRALAGVDRPDARATLIGWLEAEPVLAGAAARALGAGGPAALDVCIAALRRPERARFAALALAHLGPDGRAAAGLWRALPGASPATRIALATAVFRSPRPAPAALGAWLADERDERVLVLLVDILGRLAPGAGDGPVGPGGAGPAVAADPIDAAAGARIAELARTAIFLPLRVMATWAAAARADLSAAGPGAPEQVARAVEVLTDPLAGPMLVACVVRRGGPLSPLVEGFEVGEGLDPSSDLLDGLDDSARFWAVGP